MSLKPGIPATPKATPGMYRYLEALKQNIEGMSGARDGAVQPLPATAALSDVITAFNELLAQVSYK